MASAAAAEARPSRLLHQVLIQELDVACGLARLRIPAWKGPACSLDGTPANFINNINIAQKTLYKNSFVKKT